VGRDGPEEAGQYGLTARPVVAGGAGRQDEEIDETEAVTVLFFAAAREAAGVARTVLPAAGATLVQLVQRLRSTYGGQLEAVLPSCSIWVNRSPAEPGCVLRGGDEVALMPPVSGG
jgi:molybdopterin synthase catalytic subunit